MSIMKDSKAKLTFNRQPDPLKQAPPLMRNNFMSEVSRHLDDDKRPQ